MMRQLTQILHAKEAGVIYSLLLSLHVEIYIKKNDCTEYSFAQNQTVLEEHAVYVPEADYEVCVRALKEAGYDLLICETKESETMDETQKILKDFEKKRKWHMIEWAIVIAAVVLFQIIRSLF
ncbi:hypothetical protein P261_02226 [Lachnospiraceae bacterium TWA4]|nr:hypothetical protein P261_02226 [Lachnospiraceae bacterium TWA4]